MKGVLQFLAMAGLLVVITFACQREENELLQEEKGISLQEAKQFFEQQETEKERNGIDFKITPKWETFKESRENKDSFVYVQAVINHQKERKAEIFFAKTKNGLKGTVIAEHYVNDNLVFLISDLEGNIASMHRIKNKESSLTARQRMVSDEDCPEDEGLCWGGIHCLPYECEIIGGKEVMKVPPCLTCMRKTIHLEEVTVYAPPVKRKISIPVYYVWFPQVTIPPMQDLYGINRFFEEKEKNMYDYDVTPRGRAGYVPPVKPDHIIDKLTDPCARRILNQMRSDTGRVNIANLITPEIKRQYNFSEMIIDLFEKSSQTHLTFQNSNNTNNNANGTTSGTTITLNNNYLRTATSLAIARTMIHEMVHAYLTSNYHGYPGVSDRNFQEALRRYFATNYKNMDMERVQHEFMGQYVDAMAVSLQQWDMRYGTKTDLGFEYYKAQSYGGLFQTDVNGTITTETDSFKQLVPNAKDRQNIANKILNEQNNNGNAKGTKCR